MGGIRARVSAFPIFETRLASVESDVCRQRHRRTSQNHTDVSGNGVYRVGDLTLNSIECECIPETLQFPLLM